LSAARRGRCPMVGTITHVAFVNHRLPLLPNTHSRCSIIPTLHSFQLPLLPMIGGKGANPNPNPNLTNPNPTNPNPTPTNPNPNPTNTSNDPVNDSSIPFSYHCCR
jgi:hypothetical protein